MREDLRGEGTPSFPYTLSLILKENNFSNTNLLLDDKRDPVSENVKISYFLVPWKILVSKADTLRIVSKLMSPLTPLVVLVAKLKKMKIISQPDFAEDLIPNKKSLKSFLVYYIIKLNLSLMDKVVFATPYEEEVLSSISKIPNKKLKIIPLPSRFAPQEHTNPKDYILTVSCWKEKKNLDKMIRVFSEVLKKNPKLKLKIVGPFHKGNYFIAEENRFESGEEYEKKIMRLIQELNLSKKILFLGSKKGKELEDLFRKAKIFYLPSKFESFGMVYVEALSFGLPIIAEKNSAIKYILQSGENGFLSSSEREQEAFINKLLSDKKLYKAISNNALESSRKYQPKEILQKWEKIFK